MLVCIRYPQYLFVFELRTSAPNSCFEVWPNYENEKVPTRKPTNSVCRDGVVAMKTRMHKMGQLVGARWLRW